MESKHQSAREKLCIRSKRRTVSFCSYNRTDTDTRHTQEKRNGFGADSGMNAAEAIPDTIQCLRQQSRDSYYQQKAKRYKQTCRQTEGYLSTRFGPVIHISAGRLRNTHKKIREIGKGHTKTRLCLSSDSADERSGRRTFSETIRSLHSADETPDRRIFPGTDCLPMKMQQRLTCRAKA